ncbi:hypothetical protein [Archaeoglobus veneficus]|uniref:Uncharacterized protein n=1 Tax=Archaeoglobus veneficus (strain DSM 11195 / SNP6) TaxID=693661 RepID=F2KR47_ARCVS|nr:hypothetical protein [Archaeoglobus veneficus]AEA46684.1 hypothetical protein Arcve_0664 [Archaeoglobus veneficus SNP6]
MTQRIPRKWDYSAHFSRMSKNDLTAEKILSIMNAGGYCTACEVAAESVRRQRFPYMCRYCMLLKLGGCGGPESLYHHIFYLLEETIYEEVDDDAIGNIL